MSHGASARDAIRLALTESYKPVHRAGRDYAAVYQLAISSTDLVEAIGHAVHLVAAAGHLRDVATEAEKEARRELAKVMEETGCHHVAAGTLAAYLSKRPQYVKIDPDKTLPAEYLHHPPPIPDKKAIKKAIEAGEIIPGASLVQPNDQQLSIRSTAR
jgi:hypothetical protein